MEIFLSESIVRNIRRNIYTYGRAKEDIFRSVSYSEMFFAITYYMGVIFSPPNSDYWNNRDIWLKKNTCYQISFYRFKEIWENIQL